MESAMRFLSSLVVAAAILPAALGLPSARAEQQASRETCPQGPGRTDLGEALKRFRQALLSLDRSRQGGAPDVIRPDPELDRAMERRPPRIGSAMPTIVPRE
jgi:hypothetical protein